MKLINFLIIPFLMCSCNYITIVHTQGTAEDVVDETHTPQTTVTPTVSVPASII